MTNYRFNHLSNEYETVAAERAALVFRGTHEVEVWRDGEEIGSLNIDIYSDIPYSDFDDKALAALGEFANENHQTMTTFTFVDSIGQYDIEAVGIDPSDYADFDDFASALIECAVQCGWTDTVTARAAVEREEHILRMSHRQAGAQPYYVGCAGVPARSGEHNDRAVFVGRDEAAVRAEMEQVWQHDAWVTEWGWGSVWEFETLKEAAEFARNRAGGDYWEEID